MLERPKLFIEFKEFLVVLVLFFFILAIRFYFIYQDYKEFIDKPFFYTTVEVLQQYKKEKRGKVYTILRVYSPLLDLNFFTKTYRVDNLLDKNIRLKIFPSHKISFVDFLSSGYIPSQINDISSKPFTFKDFLSKQIAKQHTQKDIIEFYQAIFFATSLSKELRDSISKLGVSHLVALSGFHLAILSTIVFLLIRPIYKIFQQRFFPYRFDLIDIGFIAILILGWYVWFVDSPASLLRSYLMMLIGWLVMIAGIELVSFEFLAIVVMILLLLFPKLLFSLAFWFSVLGVFYIFLLIKNFNNLNKFSMSIVISIGIFILMLPIIHIIFPTTSALQTISPILSLGFTIFYPLAILAHIFGVGWIFDNALMWLFGLSSKSIDIWLPWYYGILYISVSIGAIFFRWFFYLLFLSSVGFMIYMFIMLSLY